MIAQLFAAILVFGMFALIILGPFIIICLFCFVGSQVVGRGNEDATLLWIFIAITLNILIYAPILSNL